MRKLPRGSQPRFYREMATTTTGSGQSPEGSDPTADVETAVGMRPYHHT
ncbi:MAG: hypothetical protein R2795_13345 [Saprospiraceae bacterium]